MACFLPLQQAKCSQQDRIGWAALFAACVQVVRVPDVPFIGCCPQCAHIMAMAVQRLHKDAQVTIGPWIERGFYYDFDLKQPLTDKELKQIKKEMVKIAKAKLPFIREEVSAVPHTRTAPHSATAIGTLRCAHQIVDLHSRTQHAGQCNAGQRGI